MALHIEVPRSIPHALEIDRKTNTTFWQDAIAKEMNTLAVLKVFEFLKPGEKAPQGYQHIKMWIIFDVKMNLTRKARLVAGGHVTKAPPWDCFSSERHDRAYALLSWELLSMI
jgi:hypothetical protein